MNFNNRGEAINWIIKNQLGRRNLSNEQRMYLIGKRYEEEKKEVGGEGSNQYKKVVLVENQPVAKVSKAIEQAKVPDKTAILRGNVPLSETWKFMLALSG